MPARVAFAMLAAFGVPATLPVAGLVVVASGMSTLVPATRRRRDAAAADRGRTPAGRVRCVRSVVLDRDAQYGHAREHHRRRGRDHARLRDDATRGDPRGCCQRFDGSRVAEGRVQPVSAVGTCSDAGMRAAGSVTRRWFRHPARSRFQLPSTNATCPPSRQPEAGGVGADLEAGAVVSCTTTTTRVLLSNVHVHARSRRVRSHSRAPPARPGRSRPRSVGAAGRPPPGSRPARCEARVVDARTRSTASRAPARGQGRRGRGRRSAMIRRSAWIAKSIVRRQSSRPRRAPHRCRRAARHRGRA